jgi:hypothetical protein
VAIYTSAKALSRWPINDESTLTVANQLNVSALGEPVEGTSFFYIGQDCFSDTRNMGSNGFANRGQFYQQAYKDAIILADQATKWPTYGTDASDLYFGKDTENSQYVDNIKGKSCHYHFIYIIC